MVLRSAKREAYDSYHSSVFRRVFQAEVIPLFQAAVVEACYLVCRSLLLAVHTYLEDKQFGKPSLNAPLPLRGPPQGSAGANTVQCHTAIYRIHSRAVSYGN